MSDGFEVFVSDSLPFCAVMPESGCPVKVHSCTTPSGALYVSRELHEKLLTVCDQVVLQEWPVTPQTPRASSQ